MLVLTFLTGLFACIRINVHLLLDSWFLINFQRNMTPPSTALLLFFVVQPVPLFLSLRIGRRDPMLRGYSAPSCFGALSTAYIRAWTWTRLFLNAFCVSSHLLRSFLGGGRVLKKKYQRTFEKGLVGFPGVALPLHSAL